MPTRPSQFGERLAYCRWLRSRGLVCTEGEREFARNVGIPESWYFDWKYRPDPPRIGSHALKLLAALAGLGVTQDWLFYGVGTPPEPALWDAWFAHAPTGQCEKVVRHRPRVGMPPRP